MSTYGPMGASPNPAQRVVVPHPIMGIFQGVSAMAIFAATPFVLSLHLGMTLAAFFSTWVILGGLSWWRWKPLPYEKQWDTKVPYLPWPSWMPGWKDSEALIAAETTRRAAIQPPPVSDAVLDVDGDPADD